MSDCRVPMPAYSKDLIKSKEDKDDLPPIPDGWLALHYNNANVSTTGYETIVSSIRNYEIINHKFAPKITSTVDVLILIKEH